MSFVALGLAEADDMRLGSGFSDLPFEEGHAHLARISHTG
jgi:hypothetical protein